jgi:N-acetylmuramoyl-L-alanine amidase
MKIKLIYSPNFNRKNRELSLINYIVIHYTGMQSERESLSRLCNPTSKVSAHYLINRKGTVHRLVEDKNIAWHAGISSWGKYKNLNKRSIGIELVNKGHEFGYENFNKKQIFQLLKLCKILIRKYKIKKNNLLGHSDIAPLRKIDPGEKFPWEYLSKNNLGIWHDYKNNFLKKFRKIKISKKKANQQIKKNLKKIGYCVTYRKKILITKSIKAFQRHYRKDLINGLIDQECLIISNNLLKKLQNS